MEITSDYRQIDIALFTLSGALREKWATGIRTEVSLQCLAGCNLLDDAIIAADYNSTNSIPFHGYNFSIYYEWCSAGAEKPGDVLTINWDRRYNFRDEHGNPGGALIVAIPANGAGRPVIVYYFWLDGGSALDHFELNPFQLKKMIDDRVIPDATYAEIERSLWEE